MVKNINLCLYSTKFCPVNHTNHKSNIVNQMILITHIQTLCLNYHLKLIQLQSLWVEEIFFADSLRQGAVASTAHLLTILVRSSFWWNRSLFLLNSFIFQFNYAFYLSSMLLIISDSIGVILKLFQV